MTTETDILSILKTRFGFDQFLPLQEDIVSNVMSGNDSLVLMPTGAGKSLCYQLPALCRDGYTMVVSPLIALMKDQVDALRANGIAAAFVNSTLSPEENEQILTSTANGEIKILYVAPERIATGRFRNFLKAQPPSLIAIDEAHCISEWGHDFRPDYRNLKNLRQNLPDISLIALTATATEEVRRDIAEQLQLVDSKWFVSSFNRPNLAYSVRPKQRAFDSLVGLLNKHKNESAIIYCFSRKETENLAYDLAQQGFSAAPYHAGLETSLRRETQERFIKDEVEIIVATIAFGMGIDKPDVRLVVHYNLSKSLEGYYQETGRAGRDGLPSECVLFYTYGDRVKQDFFINQIEDPTEREHASDKLSAMVEYSELRTCRRRYMLSYFGDESPVNAAVARSNDANEESAGCGGCDVCVSVKEEFDATEISQKILSTIIRTGERFGAKHVVDVLRGSRAKRIRELEHDQLSVHGIAADLTDDELKETVGLLQDEGFITITPGEYRTLAVSSLGRTFLNNRDTLTLSRMPMAIEQPTNLSLGDSSDSNNLDFDPNLFAELRLLRKQIADERNVPAYVIFGDVPLREMAYYMPNSLDSFSAISGVGTNKLNKFGERFIETIVDYCKQHDLSPREKIGAPRRKRRKSSRKATANGRPTLSRSLNETKRLFTEGFSVDEIATERGYASKTIVSHLEKIAHAEPDFNLEQLLPAPDKIEIIQNALKADDSGYLSPVKEKLGDDFSYEEIRMVRLHMERELEPAE
ncbi:MAG: DNA helicase RecQ [Chloroflexi bacterium]|jgi:ATP-dependent DNA helicase RecQ|nr:DNA helicase RecQ [Chloroflexota bacterium]MBT5628032.1 DNA helicase RecQ [Chloroflexota bacterium]